MKAVTVLKGDSSTGGTVTFEQSKPLGPVTVTGDLKGLDASAFRGFHVQYVNPFLRRSITDRSYSVSGDLSGGCASAGSHFNPFNRNHGAPDDHERHVGDLGNIYSDDKGNAKFSFEDSLISLNGPLSIVGYVIALPSPFFGFLHL